MRVRLEIIAGHLLSSHLSDPSAARGQALGSLAHTLAERAIAAGYGAEHAALAVMLLIATILLFKFGNRQGVQRVYAAFSPARFRLPGVAAMRPNTLRYVAVRFAAVLTIALTGSPALAAPESSPIGTWSTANGHGVVAIDRCGDALCGRIVGIDRKPTEPMPSDVDGRPQCGMTIITNERLRPDGTWIGHVTDPRDGDVYQAELWLDAQGNLHLRGYIAIPALGATQTWHRFTGNLTATCGLA